MSDVSNIANSVRVEDNIVYGGALTGPANSIPVEQLNPGNDGADHGDLQMRQMIHKHVTSDLTTAIAASCAGILHVAYKAGVVLQAWALAVTVPTDAADITVDIKKNGTTILTATFDVDSGSTNYTKETGTINDSAVAAGDVFTWHVTVNAGAGTNAKGVAVGMVLYEKPA